MFLKVLTISTEYLRCFIYTYLINVSYYNCILQRNARYTDAIVVVVMLKSAKVLVEFVLVEFVPLNLPACFMYTIFGK